MTDEKLLKLYRALDNVPEVLSISEPPEIIRGDFDGEGIELKATSPGSLTYITSIVRRDESLYAKVTYLPCGKEGNLLGEIEKKLISSIFF